MEKLKPCPFCGSPAILNDDYYSNTEGYQYQEEIAVQCTKCDCILAEGFEDDKIMYSKLAKTQYLITRWNTRVNA